MSGVLNFTLGLATGQFVGAAQKAQGAVGGLIGKALALPGLGTSLAAGFAGFTSVHAGIEKVFDAFENGARLEHLSKRTGETVPNLFAMEKGFKAVGVSGEAVPAVLFQMNKALGGFNEMGEPTKDVFASLGLEVEKLKAMNAPDAFEAIAKKLAGLNNSEASNLGAKIFGRGGVGDALQVARSGEEFAEAMHKAAPAAERAGRTSASFAKIVLDMQKVSNIGKGFFAGIAEGAGPGIQMILDKLTQIDLAPLGRKIGEQMTGLTEAFQQSRFGEVFELSLKAGIQSGSNFMLGEIAKWSEAISNAGDPFGNKAGGEAGLLKKLGAGAAGVGAGLINVWSEIGNMIDPRLVNQELLDKRAEFVNKMFDIAGLDQHGILDGIQVGAVTNQFAEDLKKLMEELIEAGKARALATLNRPPAAPAGGGAAQTLAELFPTGAAFASGNLFTKFNRNALESAGGYFNGRGNPAVDYSRRTADGVGRTNQLLTRLIEQTRPNPGAAPAPWAHAD